MSLSILLVDDHSVVREGLRMFLGRDPELEIVGEAADGSQAIDLARQLCPDVVLMDLLLPVMDGIAAIAIIHRDLPKTKIVVLTSIFDSARVGEAIRAGASGYLFKDTQALELRAAVKAVAAGRIHLSRHASAYLLHELCAPERIESLTEREQEVLHLLVQGRSNKEIALTLHIVEDTVKTHVHHILVKLKVESRTQAVLAAMRLGIVTHEFVL